MSCIYSIHSPELDHGQQHRGPLFPSSRSNWIFDLRDERKNLKIILHENLLVFYMENNIENVLFAPPTPSHLGKELRTEKKEKKKNNNYYYSNMYLRRNTHKNVHYQIGLSHLLYKVILNSRAENKPSLFYYCDCKAIKIIFTFLSLLLVVI